MNKIVEIIGKENLENIKDTETNGNDGIVMTAVDSIFSIQAKYASTIVPLVQRFRDYVKSKGFDDDAFTPKDFICMFKDWDYDKLAEDVFKNKQRTSSTNGILKAEAVYNAMDMFNHNNIQSKNDLLNSPYIEEIEKEWRSIKGQGSGITWRYFLMGCGIKTYFKDDTWIYRFFINELGYKDIEVGNYEKLKIYFKKEYKELQTLYPQLTVRKLDNVIWEYMSTRK